ncbi:hypothetical protein KSP40_PGU000647 [Platanthera guangdongensis]|uniref:Uncharacterized protein n=1 Tax=Platanthera guangdongensis TaxID=2320717 RepID=A0ABR2MXG8_9ASPA
MRETRCRCRSFDNISISVWNSLRPWSEEGLPRFTASFTPSSRTPKYTLPNPPTPITFFSSKFEVACWSSAKVKNL